uniref:Uncharacterized protein n=1 Tax=Anopheles atroparvus TaxID=41427 RepID=A0AAG5D494_ANOAO
MNCSEVLINDDLPIALSSPSVSCTRAEKTSYKLIHKDVHISYISVADSGGSSCAQSLRALSIRFETEKKIDTS